MGVPTVRPCTILVVDDEKDIRDSLQGFIEAKLQNTKVVTAPSGRAGLEILERVPTCIVVSDFKMPGMNGIEFLVEARRRFPHVPRVMLTAYANDDLAQRALREAVIHSFLSKGPDPEELIRVLDRILRSHAHRAT